MTQKYPLCPEKIRRVPKQFSWVDHRLVRDRYLERLSHKASTLYLFLITVGDSRGISFYSDKTTMNHLSMDKMNLEQSRRELVQFGLIAYKRPLYQVLSLEIVQQEARTGDILDQPISFGQILKQMMGEAS